MRVAFQFSDPCPVEVARVMIASVRAHLNCEIVQISDMLTPKLDEADSINRVDDEWIGRARMQHLAQLDGDVLYLDYDTIVMEDVSDVFDRDFDVALTRRPENDESVAPAIAQASPHNNGVMFSRNPVFWSKVLERYSRHPAKDAWMTAQIVITETAHALRDEFRIIELPGERYNYTPKKQREDLTGRAIVHYKGMRKEWMVRTQDLTAARKGNQLVESLMTGMKREIVITQDHPLYEANREH